jgi:hypothetical protein
MHRLVSVVVSMVMPCHRAKNTAAGTGQGTTGEKAKLNTLQKDNDSETWE